MPEQIAQARQEQITQAGKNIYFAWVGGIRRGEGHYYRVQAPTFPIEYDHTQDGNNHIPSFWRDFTGDFGGDLIKAPYEASHR